MIRFGAEPRDGRRGHNQGADLPRDEVILLRKTIHLVPTAPGSMPPTLRKNRLLAQVGRVEDWEV